MAILVAGTSQDRAGRCAADLRDLLKLVEPIKPVARGTDGLNVEALAAKVTAIDRAIANGSSIAMLLEHRGVSLLLGADAFPQVARARPSGVGIASTSARRIEG